MRRARSAAGTQVMVWISPFPVRVESGRSHSGDGTKVAAELFSRREWQIVDTFYFSFLQNFTQRFFGLWETHKVPGSMIMHGTTLHLFVILFPVQYMEKRFVLETKAHCIV